MIDQKNLLWHKDNPFEFFNSDSESPDLLTY